MKRYFQRFRDDRFALTTLQNPNIEIRTHAQLVQTAQQEREWQARAAQIAAPQPLATTTAPDSIPVAEIHSALELPEALPENVASTALAPDPTAPAPLDSTNPDSVKDDAQQLLDSLVADVLTEGSSLPTFPSLSSATTTFRRSPAQNRAADQKQSHFANLNRAIARFILRSRSAGSKGRLASVAQPRITPLIQTNHPNPPRLSATPANVPSAAIPTASILKKPSCNGAAPTRSGAAGTSRLEPPSTTTPTPSIFSLCAVATCSSP